ncbi:MAG TPA: hypothetical protein VF132_06975, partial [Rudaea sp.]
FSAIANPSRRQVQRMPMSVRHCHLLHHPAKICPHSNRRVHRGFVFSAIRRAADRRTESGASFK